jgi:hypothetical protein
MSFGAKRVFAWTALLLLAACGHQSLDMPEELLIHDFPAKKPFTLTVVMKACSDLCSSYDQPSCKVSIATQTVQTTTTAANGTVSTIGVQHRLIQLDVHVGYTSHTGPECAGQCGPQILAHCNVGALDPGAYTVVSGSFRQDVTVK